ncbi:leucine-rich repeat-containing protein 14 [Aythya fuligula]|uniref:Leucine-rich repeat-containing protein 14 n=1 Tax=Aythya fuligula TaxID=219594 RepID=A0A6J3CJU9_AYTFU|nr:leucine-rich repeat-containing protein 14 [Aythya fuligula]XP_032039252.1 leucine-rich repeat-containing protein 14 [Aythya fuligula]XP_032039253.1 leucine-rich repeat-containing protein 14 [Aythya fuligula]XP_032039254.1 leucine-rich repeat-containing protein 14 [Aythya fuligula]
MPPVCSLVHLCARRLAGAHGALPRLPAELYPALLEAALAEPRVPLLRDLVRSWPYPVLRLPRRPRRARRTPGKGCLQALLLAVAAGMRRDESPRPCLRVLDVTGLQDGAEQGPDSLSLWSGTVLLAKACLESSQRREDTGGHRGSPPPSVEVRVDLFVNSTSGPILRAALRAGGALRLRCRDFHAEELSLGATLALLEALEPAGLRRVDLRFNNLGLPGLVEVLPRLERFPALESLRLPYSNVDARRPGAEDGLRRLAEGLGRLQRLRELNLGSCRLSGRLRQLLGALQLPLESLELPFCHLLPGDLAYLIRSPHAPALKKLDVSGNNLSEDLLQPFLQLLETASGALHHLDAMECRLADAHLDALLPALRRCARLGYLGFFGNPLTSRGVKALAVGTAPLAALRLVIYPRPVDFCGDEDLPEDEERSEALQEELQRVLRGAGRDEAVWTTSLSRHRALDYFAL